MKTMSATESPGRVRKVPKPQMEKRRRDRINHSLETLRLLMLENTRDERLKNPKVEKAEILESVVQFLKTGAEAEKKPAKRALPREQSPTCTRQNTYREGVRSCLMRVSHFIAAKSQELEETGGESSQHPASPGPNPRVLMPSASSLSPPLPYLSQARSSGLHCGTRALLSPAAATDISDPVWRPWPQ
ncbi:hairy-related 5 [Genypterus blacodes]|uniref:hairy-related 5 n=1 Tax=Genypterus blacodes TaxID=154954 RepID=UPI003F766084